MIPSSGTDAGDGSKTYLLWGLLFGLLLLGGVLILVQTAVETPGELTITDVEPGNATVDENEMVELSVTVENTGDSTTSEVVEIWVGEEEYREVLTLDAGETETIDVNPVVARQLGLGNTSYSVATANDHYRAVLTVTSERPASFQVINLSPGEFTTGNNDRVDVAAEIMNIGGQTATKAVELRIDGQTVTAAAVTIEPGETETFEVFNVGFGGLEPGTRTYGVATPDNSARTIVHVPEPATVELLDFEPGDVTIAHDEAFEVTATVENTGELVANRSLVVSTADQRLTSERIELAPGEVRTVEFEPIQAGDVGVGTTRYWITTGDRVDTAQLVVEGYRPAEFEVVTLEPSEITLDEDGFLSLSTTIQNTGEQTGMQTISLYIDGEEWLSSNLELRPGESDEFRIYSLYLGSLEPGTYEYEVVTERDSQAGVLEIEN